MTPSTLKHAVTVSCRDPVPRPVLKTILHMLKQITFIFDAFDGIKTYLDVQPCCAHHT